MSGQQGPQGLLQAASELRHDGQELTSRGASLAERFAFYERRAVLLEQIAAADPDDPVAAQAAPPPRRPPPAAKSRRPVAAPTEGSGDPGRST